MQMQPGLISFLLFSSMCICFILFLETMENMAAAVLEFISDESISLSSKKKKLILRCFQYWIPKFQVRYILSWTKYLFGVIWIGKVRWRYGSSPIVMKQDVYTRRKECWTENPIDIYCIPFHPEISTVSAISYKELLWWRMNSTFQTPCFIAKV